MNPDIIEVFVFCFPDGTTYWAERPGEDEMDRVLARWRTDNPDPEFADACAGGCIVRMPRARYNDLTATGRFLAKSCTS